MYKYYQEWDRDAFFPVQSNTQTEAEEIARSKGAKKLTILSVSHIITDDMTQTQIEGLSYKGPLYFDIDCKADLPLALESGSNLAKKLMRMGVPEDGIEVYLSGSKGVHLIVDARYFSTGRPAKNLPLVYAEMARLLYVPGVDFQVYSQGRGNSFRLTDSIRSDGKYRVASTPKELATLTEEVYRQLVSVPRGLVIQRPEPVKVPELMSVFEEARRKVIEKPKHIVAATQEQLQSIRAEPPQCVQRLCTYEGIKNEVNFNEVAMQVGIYIARSGIKDSAADGLVSRLANYGKSSQYSTIRDRLNHVAGQVAYMHSKPQKLFGCNAMRSLLSRRPCDGCPLEASSSAQQDDDELSAGEAQDGYFIPTRDGSRRRITNFILHPCDVFIDLPQDGTSPRRVGIKTDILKSGEKVGHILFKEESFQSRAAFLRELSGLDDLTFQGTDNDVQAIKKTFLGGGKDVGEIRQVYTAGVLIDEIDGMEVITYVEPGMSVNNFRLQGTHQMWGKIQAPPRFAEVSMAPHADAEAFSALKNLLSMNDDLVVATLAGWFTAAHFKAHLMATFHQFPLVNLYGNAGAGKSRTAGVFSWLAGTQYDGPGVSAASLPTITPYAAVDYASCTTTVPRIMNEFNRSSIRKSGLYEYLTEVMKAAWDEDSVIKGTLGRRGEQGRSGATSVSIPITSPLIILSEQEIDSPALKERTIRIHMKTKNLEPRMNQYKEAVAGREKLASVGKVMMGDALSTPTAKVKQEIDAYSTVVPFTMALRPRYSLMVILFGLTKLGDLAEKALGMPEIADRCRELHALLLDSVCNKDKEKEEETYGSRTSSEVDAVITTIGVIIARAKSHAAQGRFSSWVTENVDYLVDDKFLFIDIVLIHSGYVSYKNQQERTPPVISSAASFAKQLQEESYFVGTEIHDGFLSGRKVARLSLEAMAAKGIDISLFTNEEL